MLGVGSGEWGWPGDGSNLPPKGMFPARMGPMDATEKGAGSKALTPCFCPVSSELATSTCGSAQTVLVTTLTSGKGPQRSPTPGPCSFQLCFSFPQVPNKGN